VLVNGSGRSEFGISPTTSRKSRSKNAAEKEALSEMSDDSREPRRARTDQAKTRTLVRPGKRIASAVLGAYIVLGVFTLCFQVDVRSQECTGTANCAVSMAKGAAWSVVWPASWVVYVAGMLLARRARDAP